MDEEFALAKRVTKTELPTRLEIRRQPSVPPPTSGFRGVQKWRDAEGTVFGFAWTAEGRHWIHLLEVGTYSFVPGGDRVTALAERSVDEAWIVDGFERTVLPIALHLSGQQVLHSSAALFPPGVVGFCAYGGTGKSTIAYGLSQRGHRLIADDALAFVVGKRSVDVLPLPFVPRLLRASSEQLCVPEAPVRSTQRFEGRPRLLALVVLTRDGRLRSVPRIMRLTPSRAFGSLVPHAYRFTSGDVERKREMMTTYLELVERVPVLSLRFRPGLQRLPLLLDYIESAVDEHVGAPV
jgi:hypothetical protein